MIKSQESGQSSNVCTRVMRGMPYACLRLQFSVNKRTGYVLKPGWMISPTSKNPIPERKPRRLCVTIYCAHKPQTGILCFKDDMYVAVSGEKEPEGVCAGSVGSWRSDAGGSSYS